MPAVTFVLIHGGGSTGRFWDRLAPLLPGPVLAVDLPGRADRPADLASLTVDDEAASIVADVVRAGITDPIVLVAHSSGGLVVPAVVAGLAAAGRAVERIALNAALVPEEEGRGLDCMKPRHREGLVWAVEQATADGTVITLPGAPADPEPFRTAYGGDPLDDDQLAFVTDPVRCVADTVHHYFQPVRWSSAAGVPVSYLLNERDRPVAPADQELMAARLPDLVGIVRLDCGHLPAVTHPHELVAALG
ncbi:MAG: esterase [Acidimicrobiales bacterium]|nr:esterase [Acidimicrobiales bacterium]